jgi:hypothetical protein
VSRASVLRDILLDDDLTARYARVYC